MPIDQRKRIRPVFVVLAAATGIAVTVYTVANHHERTGHWSTEAIRVEYERIKLPDGSRALGPIDTREKYGVTAISGRYEAPHVDVLPYYRSELTANGWSYLRDFYSGNHRGESLCKKK